ncbi:MAG: hypothetical protein K6A32_02360 [Bacteroidales bacterium]|nr:hypothetical protein [Bacteroidales bacterium]
MLESILDLNATNIWNQNENEIVDLWEREMNEDNFSSSEEKLLNIIRLAYEVVHFDNGDERENAKYTNGEWVTFPRTDIKKGVVAIRKRNITRLTDLSYENVKHITAATLLELIDRNFGGGWDSIPLSVKDIIESAFEVTTTTLPATRLHMEGGTLDKKIADGYEVLEVKKGSWIEAIFAKKKAPATKLRMLLENEYDEEGNRVVRDDDEEEEEMEERDEVDEDDEEVQPSEEDETFYSSYAPEADVKDDDDDTSGLSVLE